MRVRKTSARPLAILAQLVKHAGHGPHVRRARGFNRPERIAIIGTIAMGELVRNPLAVVM